MSVTAVTYWKGGKAGDIVAAAKKAKAIFAKHGAQNFQLNRVHAGPDAGQWAVVTTFSDWASFTVCCSKRWPATKCIRICSPRSVR